MFVSLAKNLKTTQSSREPAFRDWVREQNDRVESLRPTWRADLNEPPFFLPDATTTTFTLQHESHRFRFLATAQGSPASSVITFTLNDSSAAVLAYLDAPAFQDRPQEFRLNARSLFTYHVDVQGRVVTVKVLGAAEFKFLRFYHDSLGSGDLQDFGDNAKRRYFVFNKPLLLFGAQTAESVASIYKDYLQNAQVSVTSNDVRQVLSRFAQQERAFQRFPASHLTSRMFRTLYANETFERFKVANLNAKDHVTLTRNAHIQKVLGHKILEESMVYSNIRLSLNDIFPRKYIHQKNVAIVQTDKKHVVTPTIARELSVGGEFEGADVVSIAYQTFHHYLNTVQQEFEMLIERTKQDELRREFERMQGQGSDESEHRRALLLLQRMLLLRQCHDDTSTRTFKSKMFMQFLASVLYVYIKRQMYRGKAAYAFTHTALESILYETLRLHCNVTAPQFREAIIRLMERMDKEQLKLPSKILHGLSSTEKNRLSRLVC